MARKAGVSTTRTNPIGKTAKRRSDKPNKTSGTRAPRLVPASEVPKSDTECKALAKKVEREFDEYAEHGEKAFDLVLSMGQKLYAMRHYVRNAKAGKDAWNKWCDLNGNLRIKRHQANRYIRVFVAHKKHPCKFENRQGLSLRGAIAILKEAKGGTKAASRRVTVMVQRELEDRVARTNERSAAFGACVF